MRLAKASLFVLVSFSLLLLVHAGYPECGNLPDFVLYDEHSCTSSCDDCSGNMAGCTTDTQFSQFSRMSGDASAAFEGSEGLLATPTYWHVPFARIYAGRTDFRCYATLEFMIRATVDNKPLFQRLMLSDSAGQGSWVNLEDYVEGGVIDNTKWHKVRIPMADLKSDTYELQSVFIVNFARMMGNGANGCFSETGYYDNPTSIEASCDTPQNFYVDNIILIPGRLVIDVLGYETISERSIALRLKNGLDLEQGKAEIAANPETAFVLVSDDNVSMVPSKIGFSRTAVKAHYTGGQGYAESEWTIHLLYDTPLQANTPYVLSGLQTAGPLNQDSMEVSYNPDSISSSIQVNQLGFVPNRPKHAYVTNWLGDAGGMPVDASTFELVDTSSGTVVHTRELILRSPLDVQTGGDVYDADFSDFVTPGNYQIQIDGIGRSYSFDIHDKVYENAAYKTSRLLYYKRNIPLVEPYVDSGPGWTLARPAINPALDGVFHPILETYPLHNGETALDYRPIAPSWYDAGDYGHYMHNLYHIWPVYNLAFDLADPQDNVLNIPESGNGIPDLLDELEFGMEFVSILPIYYINRGLFLFVCI